jgi:hypothetical protein
MSSYTPPAGNEIVLALTEPYEIRSGNSIPLDIADRWVVDNTKHVHTAGHTGRLLPVAFADNARHTHTSTTPTFLFRPNSARQKHHARWHRVRLDFVYDQVHHDVFAGSMRFDFNPESRPITPDGYIIHQDLKYGTPEIRNLAQAFYPVGLQREFSTRYGVVFVSPFVAQVNLTFRSAPDTPAELPLLFDLVEGNDALPIHNARQLHKAARCYVGVRIPLVTQSVRQPQTAEHTRVILPVRSTDAQHTHAADQVRVALPIRSSNTHHEQAASFILIVHTSPFRNLSARQIQTVPVISIRHTIPLTEIQSAAHQHFVEHTQVIHRPRAVAQPSALRHSATNVVVTHISPVLSANSVQRVTSDWLYIRTWVGLFPAPAHHTQNASHLIVRVWSALLLADTRHLHRSMRLNFLPAGWVFRQVLVFDPDFRSLVLAPDTRVESIPAENRQIDIDAEDRFLTIPAETRCVELVSDGRASTVEI